MDTALTRLAPPPGARTAVVGGCGAFGRAVVDACLASDLRVAILDLPRSLEQHPPPAGVDAAIALDARDERSVDRAFGTIGERWGGLDVLVHLVGYTITPPARLASTDVAQWDDVVDGNLRSAFLAARRAVGIMGRDGHGTIVMVSSGLAFAPMPGFGVYAAAKAGLVALTKALAVEHAPAIRANAVAPSAARTAFMAGGTGRGPRKGGDEWFAELSYPVDSIPLGRMCEPDDVVGPVLFLAGPGSRFMTGQVLHVNGGRSMP